MPIAPVGRAGASVCPSCHAWSWRMGGTPDLSDRGSELGLAAGCSGCGDDSGEDTANCTSAHAADRRVGEEPAVTSASRPAGCHVELREVLFAPTLPQLQAGDN